jgi:hypothetical protein
MVVNRDQENAHSVRIVFHDAKGGGDRSFSGPVTVITFGSAQYQWHPAPLGGSASPDGPAARSSLTATAETVYQLPKASVTVIRGTVGGMATPNSTTSSEKAD